YTTTGCKNPAAYFGNPKLCLFVYTNQIASKRNLQAPSYRSTIDRSNKWLINRMIYNPGKTPIRIFAPGHWFTRTEFCQIHSGTKSSPTAGDNPYMNRRIVLQVLQRIAQLLRHVYIDCIQVVRPVQRDHTD